MKLRILTGLEIGEPHWFADETDALLSSGRFDRVLGSLHSTTIDAQPRLIDEWYAQITTAEARRRSVDTSPKRSSSSSEARCSRCSPTSTT